LIPNFSIAGRTAALVAAMTLAPLLSGCQTGSPSRALNLKSTGEPVDIIVLIGRTAHACWFVSKDPGFGGFRLADEAHSPAGRPRLLLVPRRDPGGLPKLVIQAEKVDGVTDIQVYGPALSTNLGSRITGDVERWVSGNSNCR
jgi:hypothetical protein